MPRESSTTTWQAVLADTLGGVPPVQVCFWSGAGVSLNAPTSLPSGASLTNRVADWLFRPGTLQKLAEYYEILDVRNAAGQIRTLPRLEFLLEVAEQTYGLATFDVLSDMEDAPSNWLHNFYAQHIAAGGRHITANFDTSIERALGTAPPTSQVVHFHDYFNDDSRAQLGATIARIGKGLESTVRENLRAVLSRSSALVVAGYSGSDFFDIDPFIRDEAEKGSLDHLAVVWITHDDATESAVRSGSTEPIPMLAELGRTCTAWRICGETRRVHQQLESMWGFDVAEPPSTSPPAWRPTWNPTSAQLDLATFRLWRALGLANETAASMRRCEELPERERIEAEAAMAWQAGRYSDARRCWRSLEQENEAIQLHVRERVGATLWASGRLLPAWIATSLAVRFGRRRGLDTSTVAETLGRIVEHMVTAPDVRWFGRRVRERAVREMAHAGELASVGQRARLQDAQRILSGATETQEQELDEVVETLGQIEDLHGTLTFRHRQLRERLERGEPVGHSEVRALASRMQLVGAQGDAARLSFVRGASLAFSWTELRKLFSGTQYGAWQRVRIVGLRSFEQLTRR